MKNEGSMGTEFERVVKNYQWYTHNRFVGPDGERGSSYKALTVSDAEDIRDEHNHELFVLIIEAHNSDMRGLEKIYIEFFEMQRKEIAEMEQKLRAEQEHSKQLVADCRSCKKVQELEKSTKWYADFTRAQDKSLTKEIQRANLAESLVEHLRSEVDALKNDLSIAKEANKRYRAKLSQRNGLVPADKAIK